MLALSRSLVDRRILGALELIDDATQERITAPMMLRTASLSFVRNRSGLHVINGLVPRTGQEQALAQHLGSFDAAPGGMSVGAVDFGIEIFDPAGRYVPRKFTASLPRGEAVGEAMPVAMYAAAAAPVGQNWSGVRATLQRQTPSGLLPLAGALVSLLRASDDQVLGRGVSDLRGEVLAVAVGLPIIDFTVAPAVPGNSGGNGAPAPSPAPLGTKKVTTKLRIETNPGQPWPTDPDTITATGQSWVPSAGNLPTIELETGRIVSDGLSLLLKPQT